MSASEGLADMVSRTGNLRFWPQSWTRGRAAWSLDGLRAQPHTQCLRSPVGELKRGTVATFAVAPQPATVGVHDRTVGKKALRVHGQISRAFGQNRRIMDVVANLT